MASKTSILIFYLRLFTTTQQVLRVATWIVLSIVNIGGIIMTFVNTFQCSPVAAAFTNYGGLSDCQPMIVVFLCSAPMNIVTDLAILLLIVPVLTTMTLPQRQKLFLVFTYSLGIFVLVVDIVRVSYLVQTLVNRPFAPAGPQHSYNNTRNGSWNTSLSYMWSVVDVNISIVCACIPTLKPLVTKYMPWAVTSPQDTKSSSFHTIGSGSRNRERRRPTEHPAFDLGGLSTLPTASHEDYDTAPVQRQAPPPRTRNVHGTKRRRTSNTIHFNFVNLRTPSSITRVSSSESPKYCLAVIIILVLLPGFWSSMLFAFLETTPDALQLSVAESIGLYSAYFGGGYFFGPLIIGDWMLRRDEHPRFQRDTHDRNAVGGFKATFIVGMCIYGSGAVMLWPSVVTRGFWGLFSTNLVVGFGAGVIETAANPFLILCGPRQHAEIRILVAKGFQGLASVLSNVITRKVFGSFTAGANLPGQLSSKGMIHIQWISLSPAILCAILACVYFYISIPETCDAELEDTADYLPVDPTKASLGGLRLKTASIFVAVFAQWTYVSSQKALDFFSQFALTGFVPGYTPSPKNGSAIPPLSVNDYTISACSAFALSQFIAAFIAWLATKFPRSRFIPAPRMLLGALFCICLVSAILCVFLNGSDHHEYIQVPLLLFCLAGGPIWPLIYALGLRGQGAHTKRASTLLTMAASGPAVWPFVMFGIVQSGRTSESLRLAFLVVACLVLSGLVYPAFLTLVGDARRLVDPVAAPVIRAVGMDAEMVESHNNVREGEADVPDPVVCRGEPFC